MSIDVTAPRAAPSRHDLRFLLRRATRSGENAASVSAAVRAAAPRWVVRVPSGERTMFTPAVPMITLNRLQSGIGLLTFEAIGPDTDLGCAYALTDGRMSTVRYRTGVISAPAGSRTPVILARRQRLTVDLRQNRGLARMIVYGRRSGGVLVMTTAGGARVDLPLDPPPDHRVSDGTTVFLAVYNVGGELVIRAEMTHVDGAVRDACRAYGFDRIAWLDDRTPVA